METGRKIEEKIEKNEEMGIINVETGRKIEEMDRKKNKTGRKKLGNG